LTLVFIALFEFGPGPITWLYMAEIMQDKAVSIATVMNWMVCLLVSLVIPKLVDKIGIENLGYIFIAVGAFSVIGFIFMFIFLLETRGKTT